MFYQNILYEINFASILLRVVLSLLIGGILGLERGSKRHPAGFRTYMLVCLGSSMVMMTNQYIVETFGGSDPARLGAQVISGIGFLGAGTIIVTRRNQIKGLTTAAGLWSAACLGLAIGIGFYEGAVIVGLAVFLIMTVFRYFENWMTSKTRYLHLYLGFASMKCFNQFIDYCNNQSIKVRDMEMIKSKQFREKGVFAILILRYPKREAHSELISRLDALEGVNYVEEL